MIAHTLYYSAAHSDTLVTCFYHRERERERETWAWVTIIVILLNLKWVLVAKASGSHISVIGMYIRNVKLHIMHIVLHF